MVQAFDRGFARGGYRSARRAGADTLAGRTRQVPGDLGLMVQMYAIAGDPDDTLHGLETMLARHANVAAARESRADRSSRRPALSGHAAAAGPAPLMIFSSDARTPER
jgi:hypothetical protein